jgi:DNA-binding GntR family transcriptional regulator
MNRNTVLRALRLLGDEGLLEFRRGHGITVACPAAPGSDATRRAWSSCPQAYQR